MALECFFVVELNVLYKAGYEYGIRQGAADILHLQERYLKTCEKHGHLYSLLHKSHHFSRNNCSKI